MLIFSYFRLVFDYFLSFEYEFRYYEIQTIYIYLIT